MEKSEPPKSSEKIVSGCCTSPWRTKKARLSLVRLFRCRAGDEKCMYTTSVERPTGSADMRRSHRDSRRCSGGQSPAIRGCLSDLRGPRTRSRLARGARDVWSRHKTHAQRSARKGWVSVWRRR
eukprot:5282514-Prymnesium_polylepis.5